MGPSAGASEQRQENCKTPRAEKPEAPGVFGSLVAGDCSAIVGAKIEMSLDGEVVDTIVSDVNK